MTADDTREALRAVLPHAINFRFLPPRSRPRSGRSRCAAELDAALAAARRDTREALLDADGDPITPDPHSEQWYDGYAVAMRDVEAARRDPDEDDGEGGMSISPAGEPYWSEPARRDPEPSASADAAIPWQNRQIPDRAVLKNTTMGEVRAAIEAAIRGTEAVTYTHPYNEAVEGQVRYIRREYPEAVTSIEAAIRGTTEPPAPASAEAARCPATDMAHDLMCVNCGHRQAAIRGTEAGLDVERLARALTTLDPDTGQDDWQLIHVSQDDDYGKSRREWAAAIATEYARPADSEPS